MWLWNIIIKTNDYIINLKTHIRSYLTGTVTETKPILNNFIVQPESFVKLSDFW